MTSVRGLILINLICFVTSNIANGGQAAITAVNASNNISGSVPMVAAVGTANAPPCGTGNMLSCAMVVSVVAQIVMSLGAAKGARDSATALSSGQNWGGLPGGGGGTAVSPSGDYQANNFTSHDTAAQLADLKSFGLGGLAGDFKNLKQAAESSGVALSADGSKITFPNGKTVSTASLASDAGKKAAGFSDSDIAAANRASAEGMKNAEAMKSKIASMTNDQGGGGGGSGSRGGDTGDSSGGGGSAFGGLGGKRGAGGKDDKGVAGMSKKLGNDSIGVAGDNIFEMVTRRYQARDKADAFLKK